jgi:hypothetical protein
MSELANKLIEENKRTKATTLDLKNCGLSEIPAESVNWFGWSRCIFLRR